MSRSISQQARSLLSPVTVKSAAQLFEDVITREDTLPLQQSQECGSGEGGAVWGEGAGVGVRLGQNGPKGYGG